MRARRIVIALPVILTVLIAAVIGGLIAVQNQQQSDQVAEAEVVAQDYLADVERFRTRAVEQIAKADGKDPATLKKVVDRITARPPSLPDAQSYGREHSNSYAEAAQTEATVLLPFERLSLTLGRADTALDFILAARKALKTRATDYVGFGFVTSSGPVRSSLIPAFTKARDEFDAAAVPKGQQKLAKKVRSAVQYVIDQAFVLADRIDRRQNFSFTYQEEFQAAADAVSDYATQVKGDVAEAVNAVTADVG